jgi:DNA-binding response OmpR family regulator
MEPGMKVLIADDDADLRALIGFTLTQGGFDVCVAEDGESALRAFKSESPQLLLLDVNMPPPNGFDVCREVRRQSSVPIMMLTVRDQEDDLVAALDGGADDYVRKPFSPRALLARVRALARRAEPFAGIVEAENTKLDLEQHTFQRGEAAPIHLTPLELKALQILMNSGGRTVTIERMLNSIWGRSTSRERRTLKQLIYRLRHKLEADPGAPEVLLTTPGAGYKLNLEHPASTTDIDSSQLDEPSS